MILFFYGEDSFRLKQKIKDLKNKFIDASLGDTNLVVLDGKTVTYDEIVRQILAMPFLAKSRLVIIENAIALAKAEIRDKIVEFLPKVPSSTVLAFVEEGNPDKRTSLFKKLNLPKQAQEFKPLEGVQLNKWVKDEVQSREGDIESEAVSKLIEYVGNDLWRLSNELDKLTAYKSAKKCEMGNEGNHESLISHLSSLISSSDIELLVHPQLESNVFDMIDALATKDLKKSARELHRLLDSGEAELKILTMIVYQFRNLLIVKDQVSRGVTSQWDMAKKAGLHPFVAQKTLVQCKNYSFDDLKAIYKMLLDYDLKMKTGQLDPKTGLDLLVVKLCE